MPDLFHFLFDPNVYKAWEKPSSGFTRSVIRNLHKSCQITKGPCPKLDQIDHEITTSLRWPNVGGSSELSWYHEKFTMKNNGSLKSCILIHFRVKFHFTILGYVSHEDELMQVDTMKDDGIRGSVSWSVESCFIGISWEVHRKKGRANAISVIARNLI